MTTKPTILSRSTIRLAFGLALAFGATLSACEDVKAPKARTSIPATPPVTQAPPPAITPPAPPPVAPEAKVEAPVEAEKPPLGALAGARKHLEDGALEEALTLAKQAVDETPGRSAAWNTLGRAQLRLGKRAAAITSFERAVECNPRNSYARNNLGLALLYDKQYEEAVASLEEAVGLEPAPGYMWNNLGMAYEQLDRLEEARDAYVKAAELQSGRAKDSLARLKGVETVIHTAKVETDPKVMPVMPDDTQKEGEGKPTTIQ